MTRNLSNRGSSNGSGIGNRSIIMRYIGLGAQFFATILVMLLIGWKADQWLGFTTPLLIWLLPLLGIVGTLIKIIIDTSKKLKQ